MVKCDTTMRLTLVFWLVLATVVSPAASAGSDFARIGNFSIQRSTFGVGSWYDASEVCALKIGARLCTASEWVAACRARIVRGKEPEWVSDVGPEDYEGRSGFRGLILFPDCVRGEWVSPRQISGIRCCRSE